MKQSLDTGNGPAHTVRVNPDGRACSSIRPALVRRIIFRRFLAAMLVGVAFVVGVSAVSAAVDPALDWPGWRGPTRDGVAASGQTPPVQWSETEGILWK